MAAFLVGTISFAVLFAAVIAVYGAVVWAIGKLEVDEE